MVQRLVCVFQQRTERSKWCSWWWRTDGSTTMRRKTPEKDSQRYREIRQANTRNQTKITDTLICVKGILLCHIHNQADITNTLTFCVSGSINQFQAPVAVQTETTIRITETNVRYWCISPENKWQNNVGLNPLQSNSKYSGWEAIYSWNDYGLTVAV